MPDSMSLSHDDDDMLASIRILVSDRPDDGRAPSRPPRNEALPPLLLTEAHRIDLPLRTAPASTLREMVAEAVREELQGTAGTRFTRQLRRLIRAEIAEALAARER